jgi:hypothetical protein
MSTQFHSKEQSKEHSTEFSREQKHTREEFTTNQGKTEVVIEKVEVAPVIVEHHHHHTHTVIHPEIVREHDTTEIRQIIKPIYERVQAAATEEYAGKDVRVVEKVESAAEAQRKLENIQRDVQARADVTHTEEKTTSVDLTKVKDVHSTHRVIEEVTPVIIRDVDHHKTIHKDEVVVEKIQHAPEVVKEELDVKVKDMGIKEERTEVKEGRTKGYKEGVTKEKHRHTKEGQSKGTTGLKEGRVKGTSGLKNAEQTKETRIRKGVE